ncbi:MAG: hypothetical protein SGJ02_07310 [bacterium]|nr:hypothetical protein [bacterium]
MNENKQKGLSRDQAAELYKDLQKTLGQMKNDLPPTKGPERHKAQFSSASSRIAKEMQKMNMPNPFKFNIDGQRAAFVFLVLIVIAKISISAVEYTGFGKIEEAKASVLQERVSLAKLSATIPFSKEEVEILTQLDKRRAELEERSERIADREQDFGKREMELAARFAELKSMTDSLKVKREQNERKRDGQLEQLSKVYGSMAPEESAKLMDQLDITIALSLLQRMPDKRIAQILSLMTPERALALTKMLSQ